MSAVVGAAALTLGLGLAGCGNDDGATTVPDSGTGSGSHPGSHSGSGSGSGSGSASH